MSSDKLIYLIAAEPTERESLENYLRRHQFHVQIFDSLSTALSALQQQNPTLIVLAGSNIPSPDICQFAASVEQQCPAPIIALLTKLQTSIVMDMAESENLWTAEYPISLREIRTHITEALDEIASEA